MNVELENQIKYLQQSKSIINLQCGQTQSQNPKFDSRVDLSLKWKLGLLKPFKFKRFCCDKIISFKCIFPMSFHVRSMVGWLIGRSVI